MPPKNSNRSSALKSHKKGPPSMNRKRTQSAQPAALPLLNPPLGIRSSRQQVIDPQVTLDFIKEPDHRKVARSLQRRMYHAYLHGQANTCAMMGGMFMECLVDYIIAITPPSDITAAAQKVQLARQEKDPSLWRHFNPTDSSRWTLAHRVAIAGPEGLRIMTKETEAKADMLRAYRNYVHPAQERKSPLRPWDAATAMALVRHVIEDVRVWAKSGRSP